METSMNYYRLLRHKRQHKHIQGGPKK